MISVTKADFIAFNRAVIDGDIGHLQTVDQEVVDYAASDYSVLDSVFSICKGDKLAVVTTLLDRGFDPNLVDDDQKISYLTTSVRDGCYDIAKCLLMVRIRTSI